MKYTVGDILLVIDRINISFNIGDIIEIIECVDETPDNFAYYVIIINNDTDSLRNYICGYFDEIKFSKFNSSTIGMISRLEIYINQLK